jgi:hypothetical protein
MPPLDELVIVDAETGREVRRFGDLIADGWWWEYPNFAWDADGQLLVTSLGPDGFRYRRIDVTTGAVVDVTLPRDGSLESSPDGATMLLFGAQLDRLSVWVLDDRLESTRLVWEGEGWRPGTWSPDGTRIAGQSMSVAPPPRNMAWTTHVLDVATGALTTQVDDEAVEGQLLWLPAD